MWELVNYKITINTLNLLYLNFVSGQVLGDFIDLFLLKFNI